MIQSNNGELRLILRVRDDGSLVVNKFADNAEKSAKKSSKAFDDFASGAGVSFQSVAFYGGLAAAAIVAAGVAMVKSSIDSAAAAGKLAGSLKSTSEEVSKLIYAAGVLGDLSKDEVAQGLAAMNNGISDAAKGFGFARFAIKDLGLDAQQLARMRPEQAIEAISAQLAKIPSQVDRVAIANDIFRGSSEKWVRALQGGPPALREAYEEAERFGKVISTDTAKAAQEFNDNVVRLKANLEGMAATISGPLIRSLANLTDRLLDRESLDALSKRRAELAIQISNIAQMAELDPHFAREKREALLKEIDDVDQKIIIANKKLAASLTPGAGGAGGGPVGGNSRQAEQFAMLLEDLKKQSAEAQQQITDDEFANAKIRMDAARHEWTFKAEQMRTSVAQRRVLSAELDNLDAALQAAARHREEEKAIETRDQVNAAVAQIKAGFDERYAANLDYAQKAGALAAAFESGQIKNIQDYNALVEQLNVEHQAKLGDITAQGVLERQRFERMTLTQQGQYITGWLASTTAAAATHNKTLFEINKAAGIANAIISGKEAATKALAIGGPFWGPILAGIVWAAAAANIAEMARTHFGQTSAVGSAAGGGIPAAGAAGAGAAQPFVPSAPPAGASSGPLVQVIFQGHFFGTQEFLNQVVIPGVQQAVNARDVILFDPRNSRQARELRAAA